MVYFVISGCEILFSLTFTEIFCEDGSASGSFTLAGFDTSGVETWQTCMKWTTDNVFLSVSQHVLYLKPFNNFS